MGFRWDQRLPRWWLGGWRVRGSTCAQSAPESVALSQALKKAGFAHVGPTTMYALMEAIGLVDDHLEGCHRRGCADL